MNKILLFIIGIFIGGGAFWAFMIKEIYKVKYAAFSIENTALREATYQITELNNPALLNIANLNEYSVRKSILESLGLDDLKVSVPSYQYYSEVDFEITNTSPKASSFTITPVLNTIQDGRIIRDSITVYLAPQEKTRRSVLFSLPNGKYTEFREDRVTFEVRSSIISLKQTVDTCISYVDTIWCFAFDRRCKSDVIISPDDDCIKSGQLRKIIDKGEPSINSILPKEGFVNTCETGLTLREGPSVNNKRICVIPKGADIQIIKYDDKEVELNGRFGRWVNVNYKDEEGAEYKGYVWSLDVKMK